MGSLLLRTKLFPKPGQDVRLADKIMDNGIKAFYKAAQTLSSRS